MRTQVGSRRRPGGAVPFATCSIREGVDCVVLESRSRQHIETRVRAGVLDAPSI